MYMPRTCNLLKNLVIHFRTGSKRPQLRPEKLNNPSSYSGHNESYTSVRSSIKRVGVLINFSLPRIVDVLIFPKQKRLARRATKDADIVNVAAVKLNCLRLNRVRKLHEGGKAAETKNFMNQFFRFSFLSLFS